MSNDLIINCRLRSHGPGMPGPYELMPSTDLFALPYMSTLSVMPILRV